MTPEPTRQQTPQAEHPIAELAQLRRHRWLVPTVVVLLAGSFLASFYVVPPLYRAHKRRKAEAEAALAAKAIDRQDWKEAAPHVVMAVTLAPENPEALRQAARITTMTGNAAAMFYWQQLFLHGTPTRDDRMLYARLLVRLRRTDLAREQLVEILKANPHDPEAIEVSLILLVAEGRNAEALVAARQLADENPDRPGAELMLARTLLATGNRADRAQARQILWALAFRPRSEAFAAISELSNLSEVTPRELRLLARRVPETQTNALLRSMVEWNIRFRLEPKADKSQAARTVLGNVGDATPVDERLVATDWLMVSTGPTNALVLASEPWFRTNEMFLQRRIQALALLDRWKEVSNLVEDDDMPLDPVMRELHRAIISSHQNRPEEAANHLSLAAGKAKENPDPLLMIAGYAEVLDQPRIAAAALQPLLGNPTLAPATGQRILGLLKRVDDIPPMLMALDRLLLFDPSNDGLRNEQAWLRLLAGERIPESRELAAKLVEGNPSNPKFRASLALGWFREGEFEKAFEATEDKAALDPAGKDAIRLQLVRCAALGAIGQRDAARQLAKRIPLDNLRSEERVLIREWLEKPTGS